MQAFETLSANCWYQFHAFNHLCSLTSWDEQRILAILFEVCSVQAGIN